MYKVGQNTSTPSTPPRQPGESRWAWWVLPIAGGVLGDRVAAGEFRPYLVLPHKRWRVERKGRMGAVAGTLVGAVAAFVIARGDFTTIPPEMI